MTTALNAQQVQERLAALTGWTLTRGGTRIRKDWSPANFLAGLDFFSRVATVAEEMQHHPDLHLENYKDAWIEIWTHTVGGLTDSDFILAQRIDALA